MALLEVKDLGIQFGGLKAVDGFHMEIGDNELIGLIGPNGAGKTTVFNMLTGVYQPTDGEILFDGSSISGLTTYEVTKKHMARTFQNIRLYKEMSVSDNIKTSCSVRRKYSLIDAIFHTGKYYKVEQENEEQVQKLLKMFGLEDKADLLAKNLPYGDQRRLEIARALATEPKLLLLDEPAAGMNPQETEDLAVFIKWIKDEFKISILLIEHDMKLVMGICEKITVLNFGKIIAEGTPKEIQNNPQVIEAYIGRKK
ncbi:MAG: ABC transporter ATP-binding protein [Lachnospiraceae bacterium]|nr:ABC transporter ATP-binding protein [Lachnospiraceae bacterium]